MTLLQPELWMSYNECNSHPQATAMCPQCEARHAQAWPVIAPNACHVSVSPTQLAQARSLLLDKLHQDDTDEVPLEDDL